jgi:hypothetical protein
VADSIQSDSCFEFHACLWSFSAKFSQCCHPRVFWSRGFLFFCGCKFKARNLKKNAPTKKKKVLWVFSRCFSRRCIIRRLFIVTERLVSVACQSYTSRSLAFIYLFASCFTYEATRTKGIGRWEKESTARAWHWKLKKELRRFFLFSLTSRRPNFPHSSFRHDFYGLAKFRDLVDQGWHWKL